MSGEPLTATQPKHFFAEDGKMPEEVMLHLTIPPEPELGGREEIPTISHVRPAFVRSLASLAVAVAIVAVRPASELADGSRDRGLQHDELRD